VHSGLSLNSSSDSKGGRRLVGTTPIAANTVLLGIPTKLMLTEDKSTAKSVTDEQVNDLLEDEEIRLALAVVLKMKKGKQSAYSPYTSMLPAPKDFHAFHPAFAGQSIRADFEELPVLGLLEHSRTIATRETRNTFQIWKNMKKSKVAKISWNDMGAALHLVRTRGLRIPGKGLALVPLFDFMNTAEDPEVNVAWSIDEGVLKVRAKKDLPLNAELLSSYCSECDNEVMLHTWGIYLVRNPVLPCAAKPVKCFANWDKAKRPGATANSLREAAEVALDLNRAKDALAAGWNSPPCKEAIASSSQGQLRCSLARLAWEACAAAWGFGTRAMSAATATSLVNRWNIMPRRILKSATRWPKMETSTTRLIIGKLFSNFSHSTLLQTSCSGLPERAKNNSEPPKGIITISCALIPGTVKFIFCSARSWSKKRHKNFERRFKLILTIRKLKRC